MPLTVEQFPGDAFNNFHETRREHGRIPLEEAYRAQSMMGEDVRIDTPMPGRHPHRGRYSNRGWDEFLAYVESGEAAPIEIHVYTFDEQHPDREPGIWLYEGNHRREAHRQLGRASIPVLIRYWGHTDKYDGLVAPDEPRQDAVQKNPPEDYPLFDSYAPFGIELRKDFFAKREQNPDFIGWRCQTRPWSEQRLVTLQQVFHDSPGELVDMLWLLPSTIQRDLETRWPGVLGEGAEYHPGLDATISYLSSRYNARVLWVSDHEPMDYGVYCYEVYLPAKAVLAMREDYAEDGGVVYIYNAKVAEPQVITDTRSFPLDGLTGKMIDEGWND